MKILGKILNDKLLLKIEIIFLFHLLSAKHQKNIFLNNFFCSALRGLKKVPRFKKRTSKKFLFILVRNLF